ncbi:RND efflux system [Klebsiella michiganensis]|nr:RND efflux system [Klebsiella michiganensis]
MTPHVRVTLLSSLIIPAILLSGAIIQAIGNRMRRYLRSPFMSYTARRCPSPQSYLAAHQPTASRKSARR